MAGPDDNERRVKPADRSADPGREAPAITPDDAPEGDAPALPDLETALNGSLNEVLDLLARQVAYLKTSLDSIRLSAKLSDEVDSETARRALIRWHVDQIDQRQDQMDQIQAMILAKGDAIH